MFPFFTSDLRLPTLDLTIPYDYTIAKQPGGAIFTY